MRLRWWSNFVVRIMLGFGMLVWILLLISILRAVWHAFLS